MKKKVLAKLAFLSIVVMVLALMVIPTETLQANDANTNPKGPTEYIGDSIHCYNTASYNCRIIQIPGKTRFVIVHNTSSNE